MSSQPWIQFDVECPRGLVDTVQRTLFELGAAGCEETYRDGETPPFRQIWDKGAPPPSPTHRKILAWFESVNGPEVANSILAALKSNTDDLRVCWAPYVPQDWEAKFREQHPTVTISPRLTIARPWNATDDHLIIEPGIIGFGTGTHPTTVQALKALDTCADECSTALDIGCGSGILALAAAKLGLQAWGFDIEEEAIENALRHSRLNQLKVDFSTLPIEEWTQKYDLVLANLHAELLETLHTDIIRLTGKYLIIAGIMIDKSERVHRCFEPHFSETKRTTDGEWVSFIYKGKRKDE